ncbi:GNAT family N-acetyltransferase [Halalkalibacterium halodurans]|uniref:GNAT family N-acetyltransferase n=1 Tax=Halalkalibacterium halodurans TaxID=86665 RepID=UPI002E22EADB|nr:GNAT family N-acetyltransferase [Halalkalibacterium halodurans]
MITIKRLKDCTMTEAAEAGNRGFEDYYVNIGFTPDRLVSMLSLTGLSSVHSVVAFYDDRPAGFILNGIRMIGGKQVAWNGGTAVVPELRRQGIGQKLMAATVECYEEQGVELATLEAFRINERAIALYETFGYHIVDQLCFLQHIGALETSFRSKSVGENDYRVARGTAHDVRLLSFYQHTAPWRTQWFALRGGQSILVKDALNHTIGYALYERVFDGEGSLASIVLYQCEAAPGRDDADEIVRVALDALFAPHDEPCKRTTFNMPRANKRVVRILQEAGFTDAHTADGVPFEQVYMVRKGSND